ncbi:MAG TPA: DoxX family membrane protein [Puia sp.]
MRKRPAIIQLYLRLALGIDFLVLGLDRLGVWGPYGSPNVSWGDWSHFSAYAHQVMPFLPGGLAEALAVLATVSELLFGTLLTIGWFTRWAAIGSGLLTLCFALSMAAAFGITSPINYSVFPVSAGSWLLATLPLYPWSIDAWRAKKNRGGKPLLL